MSISWGTLKDWTIALLVIVLAVRLLDPISAILFFLLAILIFDRRHDGKG